MLRCSRVYVLLFIVILGCKKDDPVPEKITLFNVAFDFQSKFDINENDPTEIEIPIKLDLTQEEPVTIFYEIFNQDVSSGSDFTVLSDNPLLIPPGSFSTTVKLKINDNAIVQPEDRKIYLRIRSVDLKNAKIGIPNEVVITINEDDCAATVTQVSNWFGDLEILNENDVSAAVGSENPSGLCSGKLDINGKFLGSNNPESSLTVAMAKDVLDPTKGTASIARSKLFTFTSQFEIEASGFYDEPTRKITLNYLFFDLNNSANNFESTLIISAN